MSKRKKKSKPAPKQPSRPIGNHPFLIGIARVMKDQKLSARQIALKHLKVTQQAMHEWTVKARTIRGYCIPVERVPAVSKLTGIPPFYFNPKLWPHKSWRFN